MEAVCPAGDDSQLVIQPFHDAIGQAPTGIRHNVLQMPSDRSGHFDEFWKATTACPAQPLLEFLSNDVGLSPIEDLGETLLEQVASIQPCVVLGQ